VLPIWAEVLLAAFAVTASVRAYRLARRERFLAARLQARERESHFLGESPEPERILEHAFAAASEILPLASFDLYRVDRSERIYEIWSLPPGAAEGATRRPTLYRNHPFLGSRIDTIALLQFARWLMTPDRKASFLDLVKGGAANTDWSPLVWLAQGAHFWVAVLAVVACRQTVTGRVIVLPSTGVLSAWVKNVRFNVLSFFGRIVADRQVAG